MYYYNYCCLYLTNNSLVSGSTQITFITGAAKSFFIVVQISARFGHSLVLCSSWLFESPPLASLIICIINPLDNLALNYSSTSQHSPNAWNPDAVCHANHLTTWTYKKDQQQLSSVCYAQACFESAHLPTHTHTQTENGQQRTITNLCPPFFSAEVQRLMITPINSAFLQRDVRELAASEFYSELGLFIHQLPLTEMCDCLFFYSNRILLLGGATPVMVVYLCHINSLMVSNSSCILPCNHVSFFNGQLFWQADDLKLSKSNILFSTDYRLAEFSTAFILWGEWIHKVYAWWLCVC